MELNRKQTIKVLECISRTGDVLCEGCTYRRYNGLACHRIGAKDALSLIKELTEENERLAKAKYIFATVDYCSDDLAKALEENKRLTEENERLRELGTTKEVEKEIVRRETRSDTVRKMQEQIKAEIDRFDKRGGSAFINKDLVFWFADQIAKEMLEDL
jgi:regulator of replication initiation timing